MTILVAIVRNATATAWQLLPYLLVGVLASELLRFTPVAPVLERGCRRHPMFAIPAAAVLGMASPLCTYGTVPLVLQLLRTGVPAAPLVTFLSASSLMNPQLLLLTWGGLGPRMAVARVLAVLAFALLLGALAHLLPARFIVHAGVRDEHARPVKATPPFAWLTFLKGFGRTFEFVGFYLVIGVLLGAVVEVLVPGRWIVALFGSAGWYQMLLASLLGVPLSACGGGVIPLVRGLVDQGMAVGAALAFLIAGPATRIPPLMALATIVRPLFILGYVVLLIGYSVAAGLLFQLF